MKASELMIGDYILTPLQKGTIIGNIEEIDTSFDSPDVCHITCDVGGCRAVAYAWYVWQKGYKGETIVKWIN